MKVRRLVIAIIHGNDDTKEAADLGDGDYDLIQPSCDIHSDVGAVVRQQAVLLRARRDSNV